MVAPTAPLPLAKEKGQRSWPGQGQWTYEDYLQLPDDGRRYEIIEGVLYVTNAPSYDHQFTVLKLAGKLDQFVTDAGLGVVLTAPFEVHLPGGTARPVQPDVLFIQAEQQPGPGAPFFEGAPDLVVEVLSPESVRRDQHVKFGAYEWAGVHEYWLADLKTRTVTIHVLPAGGHEYVLLGQFGPGETLHSEVLAGLAIEVEGLFVKRAT